MRIPSYPVQLSHHALHVGVFFRRTQVLLPLPLPHGLQVVGVEGGDPPTCWHLLYTNNPPEEAQA